VCVVSGLVGFDRCEGDVLGHFSFLQKDPKTFGA
jgi:hypothetical protein